MKNIKKDASDADDTMGHWLRWSPCIRNPQSELESVCVHWSSCLYKHDQFHFLLLLASARMLLLRELFTGDKNQCHLKGKLRHHKS